MDKFIIHGGIPLIGNIQIQGAKNVALKMFVTSLLTDEEIILHNVPRIRDVFVMLEIMKELGVQVDFNDHTVSLRHTTKGLTRVPLDVGGRLRTSSLVLGPLLTRFGEATIPNPGGCRLGARPIERHIEAIRSMGANILYESDDGYFHATAKNLQGKVIVFEKNTHTGTEAVILAAVLATGTTIIKNAAEEIEIDDLIKLLVAMGGKIKRTAAKEITIEGVEKLSGATHTIIPDRNEEVTFAVAAALTKGNILIHDSERRHLEPFLSEFKKIGGIVDEIDDKTTRYKVGDTILPSNIYTMPQPGFMTDWQAPWAVLMTQASGVSTIHETVFESRFSYVKHLNKMGADIDFYDPEVENPEKLYNFNWSDRLEGYHQGIRIKGPTKLHNAVVETDDIRAGATLILAALSAEGESYVYRAENVDRGYESIEERFRSLGAKMIREEEDVV